MTCFSTNVRASSVFLTFVAGAAALAGAGCNGANSSDLAATCAPGSGSLMVNHQGSGSATASPGASRAGARWLRGHVPTTVDTATDEGKVNDDQEFPVTVSLSLNNEAGLAQQLADLYNPASPSFRHFLTPKEFQAKYGPTPVQRAAVLAYLQSQGLHSARVDESGMLIQAVGSARVLGTAFGTELHQYKDTQGRAFRAPNQELQIPAQLVIQGVHGLQDVIHAHTHLRQRPANADAGKHAATGQDGGFSATDIREAYNVPASPDASGQTLAVFELDGYTASDITGYVTNLGIPAVPLQNVLVNGATGSAGGGAAEVTLDIELMIAIAPNAAKIMVYEGTNDDQGMLATYSQIASDNVAKSISTSWGSSESGLTSSFLQSENTIFMQMAAQGQTIYSAAGDSGANDDGSGLSVDDPSAQPYVVGVGGTSLTTTSTGARQAETTWNDSSGGGGGGISTVWTIPTWQQGLATAANQASSTMRNVPDVSLNADIDTGYAIYYQGGWSVWGGTSCAAPLWAGFTALVNHQRAAQGEAPLGYANPVFAQIGRSANYTADFFDINDGSTNGHYPAVTGYDDATGWGTFNATHLMNDLSSDATLVGITAGSGSNSCGS